MPYWKPLYKEGYRGFPLTHATLPYQYNIDNKPLYNIINKFVVNREVA
jgi:hypothetical protein